MGDQGPSQVECYKSGIEDLPSKWYYHGDETKFHIARKFYYPSGPTEGQYINFDGKPIPGWNSVTQNKDGGYTTEDGPYNIPGEHSGFAYNYRGRYVEKSIDPVASPYSSTPLDDSSNDLLATSVYQRRQP